MDSRSVLLDSNLTVLLAVGLADPAYIVRHKRSSAFDAVDFTILTEVIRGFSQIVFSPNVLTETSNLVRQAKDPIKTAVSRSLADLINGSVEAYVESRRATMHEKYLRLGITDSVLLTQQLAGGTILTVDFDLYFAASTAGRDVINYNHLREQRKDFR